MKLITDNGPGNVHETATFCNRLGLARFVLSIEFNGGNHSTILMRVEDYPEYCYVMETMRRIPKPQKEWLS